MKKIIVFILVTLLCFSFAACGSSSETVGAEGEKEAVSTSSDGALGDFQVQINDEFELAKDYEGNNCIVLTCKFTNNSEDAEMFSVAIMDKAYQDGVEIEKVYVMENEDAFPLDDADKSVKPGSSINVKLAYALSNNTSPVDLEIQELLSLSGEKLTKTFDIGK